MVISHYDRLILDYIKVGVIGKGAMGEVIEALALDDPTQRYAIKIINQKGRNSFQFIHRFSAEAELMSQLYHPHIISIKEFGYYADPTNKNSCYFLVMDYVYGKDVKKILDNHRKTGMSLEFFFDLAIQITNALDYSHGKNIIHRDIKPQNILVEVKNVRQNRFFSKLIDFGVATLGEVTNYIGGDPADVLDKVVGTPLYMAPELYLNNDQITNNRIDLYSLGCVLFEILVGRAPFRAANTELLGQLHVNQKPERVDQLRSDVPRLVADIIDGLLKKDPNDRYSSAFSLLSDLYAARCQLMPESYSISINSNVKNHSGAQNNFNHFQLRRNDNYRSLNRKLRVIGGSKQLKSLIQFYNYVAHQSSRGHISLVTGTRGSGKTRLISELKDFFVNRKVKFISSGFIKYKKTSSIQNFTSGFNEYLLKVYKNQPLEAKKIKERFVTILGDRIFIIRGLVPAVDLYITNKDNHSEITESSDQIEDYQYKDYSDLDPQEFCKAITDFTRCLLSFNQPIVFIFDDIEFADELTLKIIDDFFSLNNSECIYMIVSYSEDSYNFFRDHTRKFIDKMSKFRRRYQKIQLNPLNLYQVSQLVYHILSVDIDEIIPICSYLYQMCMGNPVHIIEKLRDLVIHGDITYDADSKSWNYDLDKIKNVKRSLISIDLILTKISLLEKTIIDILEVAAVSGLSFSSDVLSIATRGNNQILRRSLDYLLRESLIVAEDDYDSSSIEFKSHRYRFIHNHVREVILYKISDDRWRGINLAIARLISKEKRHDSRQVFSIANHFYQGIVKSTPYVTPGFNTYKKAMLFSMKAGRNAKQLNQYFTALKYFDFTSKILEKKLSKHIVDEDLFRFYLQFSDLRVKLDHIDQATEKIEKYYKKALNCKSNKEKINHYSNKIAEFYFSLLYRNSKIYHLVKVTDEHLVFKGVPYYRNFEKRWILFKMFLGLYLDHLSLSKNIKLAKSVSQSLVSGIIESSQINYKSKRVLMVLYFAFFARINDDGFNDLHVNHYNGLKILKKTSNHQTIDIVFLIVARMRYFNAFNWFSSANTLYKFSSKVVRKYGYIRCYTVLDIWHLIDGGYSTKQDFTGVNKITSAEGINHLDFPYDLIPLSQLLAANCTRLFLQGKQDRFKSSIKILLSKVSIRGDLFIYVLFLRMLYWMLLDKPRLISIVFNKLANYQDLDHYYKDNVIYKMVKVIGFLYTDQFSSSKNLYLSIIENNYNYRTKMRYVGYQKDLIVFFTLIYDNYYRYLAKDQLYSDENESDKVFSLKYFVIIKKFSQSFLAKNNLYFQLISIYINIIRSKSKIKYIDAMSKVHSQFKKRNWLVPELYLSSQSYQLQYYYDIHRKSSGHALSALLETGRDHRFIGFAKLCESILDKCHLPYVRRDSRGGLEEVISRFDRYPSHLAFKLLNSLDYFLGLGDLDQFLNKVFKLFSQYYGASGYYLIRKIAELENKQVVGYKYEVVSFLGDDDPEVNNSIKSKVTTILKDSEYKFKIIKNTVKNNLSSDDFVHNQSSSTVKIAKNLYANKQQDSDTIEGEVKTVESNIDKQQDSSKSKSINNTKQNDHQVSFDHDATVAHSPSKDSDSENPSDDNAANDSMQMLINDFSNLIEFCEVVDCVIPLHIGDKHQHFVYITDIGEAYNYYGEQAELEIMHWSCQMYWIMVGYGLYKNLLYNSNQLLKLSDLANSSLNFTKVHNRLDTCDWLDFQLYGKMEGNVSSFKPSQFDSGVSWLNGVSISTTSYLLVNISITCKNKSLLHKISGVIWHNINIYLIAYKQNRKSISLNSIRNDLVYFLKNTNDLSGLERIDGFVASFSKRTSNVKIMAFGSYNYRIITKLNNKVTAKTAVFRFPQGGALVYCSTVEDLKLGNPICIFNQLVDWSVQKLVADSVKDCKPLNFSNDGEYVAVINDLISKILNDYYPKDQRNYVMCSYTLKYTSSQLKDFLKKFKQTYQKNHPSGLTKRLFKSAG